MAPVEIYTTPYCPYCLGQGASEEEERRVHRDRRVAAIGSCAAKMTQRANGGTTVPQIFIGATHVGGCDDLYALDDAGKLDPLLNGQAAAHDRQARPSASA